MKTVVKAIIYLFVFILSIYLSIYFALSYFLHNSDIAAFIKDNVKRNTGLILVLHNCRPSVAPNFDINLNADDIQLFYPDKKQILILKKSSIKISAPYLLKKELKVQKISAGEFQFTTKLLKNGKTTFQQYLEKNCTKKNDSIAFSDKVPQISIDKYLFKIKDEESGQKFKITGSNLKILQSYDIGYLNFSANGEFYCFDKKYMNYNVKLSFPANMFANINSKLMDINFDNLHKYSFFANFNADIKVHEKKHKFDYLSGKIDIDDFSVILGNKKLPESFFHITLNKGNAVLISKFYTAADEVSDIKANVKVKKPYYADIKCKCPRADIANLQRLAISVAEILKIKNNLSAFTASGTVSADFNIKTNFKNLFSGGQFELTNAAVSYRDIPFKIDRINALIDFSGNKVNIKHSNMFVNNQPIKVTGIIDSNANANIEARANALDLRNIAAAFPVLNIQKYLYVNSGYLTFSAVIKGKLCEAAPKIQGFIDDFSAFEKSKNIKIFIKKITLNLVAERNKYHGTAAIHDLKASADLNTPDLNILSEHIPVKFDNKIITINQFKLKAGKANLMSDAKIANYLKTPEIYVQTDGSIDTGFIKSFLPQNIIWHSKGYLPVKLKIKHSSEMTKVSARILADPQNYITPLQIINFSGMNSLLNSEFKITGDNVIINDCSLYYAPSINSLVKDVRISELKKAIRLTGVIKNISSNPSAQNLHLYIPDNLKVKIPVPEGSADLACDILLNGLFNKPSFSGKITANNVDIRGYKIALQNACLNFINSKIILKINNLKVDNTDISLDLTAPVNVLTSYNIENLKLYSQYFDMNSVMQLLPMFPSAKYAPGAEFPFQIKSGQINIKNYKMDKINAQNITGDINSKKNILYITNLICNAYGGKVAGNITYNFPYMSVQAKLQGRDMDAGSASDVLGMTNQKISGNLNFDASVNLFTSDCKNLVKNMKGHIDLLVKNGHLGQLGRFEHFLYAQNLLSQRLIYASLNSARQAISPKDTGYISYLKGSIDISNGIATLSPVTTSGSQMSMYITGNINLLNNYTNLHILGKISSEVSSSMGVLGTLTIKDFLDEHTSYGTTIAKLFNFYNKEIPLSDIQKIPLLIPDYKYDTKTFQVQITGDPDSVKSVKNFNWVSPAGTKQKLLQKEHILLQKQGQEQAMSKTSEKSESNVNSAQVQTPVNYNNQKTHTAAPDFLDSIPDKFSD